MGRSETAFAWTVAWGIEIFDDPEPASRRGHLKTYELLETDLIRTIGKATPVAPAQAGEATAGE